MNPKREWQVLIAIVGRIVGWTLGLANRRVLQHRPNADYGLLVLGGRRYLWWECLRWALTGVFLAGDIETARYVEHALSTQELERREHASANQ